MRTRHLVLALAAVVGATALPACGDDAKDSTSTKNTTTTAGDATTTSEGDGGSTSTTAGDSSDFYEAPDPLPKGKPGEIIRSEPLDGAPAGSNAFLVLYHSTTLEGEPVAVSGMVIVPDGDAPEGGRPVLSWAHPTTGVAEDCAPSLFDTRYDLIPGLTAFLDAGFVVAATDYQGLGTKGPHPYLIGVSEGQNVLDAAVAAGNLKEADAGKDLYLFGHSQGGHASLWAGQLAEKYSPDLSLKAVAAAAPASELAALLTADESTEAGVGLGSFAINGFKLIYEKTEKGLEFDTVLTPEGVEAIPKMVKLCDGVPAQDAELVAIAAPLVGKFYKGDPTELEPWKKLLAENTPGKTDTKAPIFVAQGEADTIVVPAITVEFATKLCDKAPEVELKLYPDVPHTTIGYASAGDVLAWMRGIEKGDKAPTTCGDEPVLPPSTSTSSTTSTTAG